MEIMGIDVHKRESQLCIITVEGEVIEQRIRSERGRFADVLGTRAKAKVLLEASTESEWVARCLEELGHEVIVADPSFAPMYGTRSRRIKTDKRDARALADACMSGTYRKAHRTSEVRRQLKAKLSVRNSLVRQRAKHANRASSSLFSSPRMSSAAACNAPTKSLSAIALSKRPESASGSDHDAPTGTSPPLAVENVTSNG